MNESEQLIRVRDGLLAYAKTVSAEILLPTIVPQASPLVSTNPYAFAIATCLDRGTKAEIIWTIPFYILQDLGHIDPRRIYKMSLAQLAHMFARLPQRPRYVNDSPRTIAELTRIVVEKFKGDAAAIWRGKSSSEVIRTFMSVHGVGSGIANMAVLLIEKNFGIRFSDMDHTKMDIKPDVHTVRVLYRLGVSDSLTTDSAVRAARTLNPEFPGGVDAPLWDIGRKFCANSYPNCTACPMRDVCAKRLDDMGSTGTSLVAASGRRSRELVKPNGPFVQRTQAVSAGEGSSLATTFKGKTVSELRVRAAMRDFDAQYRNSSSYDGWLYKGTYKYAIQCDGKLYPPKFILSQVTGINILHFSGGDGTNRVFRQLGFTIISLPITH